jgi:hypothetical protein
VNKLLSQKPGKLPITEIRAAIAAQRERSEREREAVERACADSVATRLRRALLEKAISAIALFEELDVDGSGSVDVHEFALALPLLKVKARSAGLWPRTRHMRALPPLPRVPTVLCAAIAEGISLMGGLPGNCESSLFTGSP